MTEITRFSLLFDPAEDRMALDMVDDAGAVTRLWLTQRLCRGLVQAMAPMVGAPGGGEREDASRQSWAQAAAVEAMAGTPPVTPGTGATVGLVFEVNLTPSPGQLAITLRFADQSRDLTLSPVALRQTLAEMYRLHVAAGWPLDLWPAWIADPAAEARVEGAVN